MNPLTAAIFRSGFFAGACLLLTIGLSGCGGPQKLPPSGVRVVPGKATVPRPQPPSVPQQPRVAPPVKPVQPKPQPAPTSPTPPPVVVQPQPSPVPAPVQPAAPPQWIPLRNWAAKQGLPAPVRVSQNAFQVRSATGGTFQLSVGTRVASWNGIKFHLGFAPTATNGLPFIHALDAEKNLAPLLQVNRPVPRGRGIIVLDPGHGGQDVGTKSTLGQIFEKDYTLDMAKRLKPLLEQRGWRVVLTRTTDKGVELAERVLIAEQQQADLFLSLHFNSAGVGAAGLETYCLTPAGMPSTLTRNFSDPVNVALPGNARDQENMHLAMRVHRSLLQTVGMADRGVQRARFMNVLKTQRRPAILIECGYLSDRNEAKLIQSADYRQKLAQAVAKALE
ncbi:MAG: N-acetylmuramoyl-L-alanine amidase [Verrucomicrobia bacterium]|nr:N-acetylmuramoyl-L-alanine amidase [Verrucomicrobiota bacterium]